VSSWYWSSISKKCRTDLGGQPLIHLKDLVAYANSAGKEVAIGMKNGEITNAQAKQLWNTLKVANTAQLEAPYSRVAALNKAKSWTMPTPITRSDTRSRQQGPAGGRRSRG
jgi:hypothetical protein